MGFTVDITVSAVTVFFQGLLSFFSPCVLPLLPLYVSYFAGGAKEEQADGTVVYPRGKMMVQTLLFVAGISAAFFLLGFGFTALGQFFSAQSALFAQISGVVMALFGCYQLGLFGHIGAVEQERRLPLGFTGALSGLGALVLGFTFSFAWTPCIGPILSSVLLMASSSGTAMRSAVLIGVYTLGFVLPFFAVGLFTASVLAFFKKHQGVVRYTVKIGGVVLIAMGVMTFTGLTSGVSTSLANGDGAPSPQTQPDATTQEEPSTAQSIPAVAFTLLDQFGNTHTMEDYKGKVVFLNFWATWCPPCQGEMPDIQALYEAHGYNEEDLVVLGVACPNMGNEGSAEDIAAFLADNGYTFPVVMDEALDLTYSYGIQSYPTTFMIDAQGNIYGYVSGALSGDIMEEIVAQTMEQTKD